MGKGQRFPPLKSGDAFKIPLGDGRAALGQVIAAHLASIYIVVFDFAVPEEQLASRVPEALKADPVFSGLTFDGHFKPGQWEVLGNYPADKTRFLPAYKLGTSEFGDCRVIDFEGKRWRPATALEEEIIPFRKTTSSIRFERAIRAHMGLGPWNPAFDRIRAKEVVKSADIFDT